jgi:hypothetical protein
VGRRGYPPEFRRKVLDLVEAAQNRSGSYMAGGYGELLQRVEADLARFAERVGVDLGRWRGPVLGDQEVAGFLRAVDAGIATLEPGGMCRLTGLSAMARRKPYQLFSTYEGGAANPGPVLTWSWRELFTQIAFAAELVLDHGWPGRAVLLEVDRLDLAAGDPAMITTRPLLTAEAKVTDGGRAGLAAMMAVFAEFNGTQAPVLVPRDVRENAARKYRSLQKLRPSVFVEVAPGVRRAHDLEHLDDGRIRFRRRGTIPSPYELGLGR